MQLQDALGHIIGRADQRKSTVAHGKQVLDLCQKIMREAVGMGELQVHQIVDGIRVGVVNRRVFQERLGLFAAGAADDMGKGQHLDLAALGLCLSPEVCDLALGTVEVNGGREQEIGVVGGKFAALR